MKNRILVGVGSVFGLFAVLMLGLVQAKDAEVPDHKLSEFKLGDHISGTEVDLSKQKGKVVVIEYWGTR